MGLTAVCEYRSDRQVELYTWHVVRFTRQGRRGRLQVDDQPIVLGSSKGAFTQLTLSLDLFIGGHRNFDEVSRLASVERGFQGCIQKVPTCRPIYTAFITRTIVSIFSSSNLSVNTQQHKKITVLNCC